MGTRTLLVSSPSPFYWETPAAAKVDGAGETTTDQFRFEAGTWSIALSGTGESEHPRPGLAGNTFYYFVATVAAQDISFYPSSVA